jgi:DNA-binding PucR family transcriptional regulator
MNRGNRAESANTLHIHRATMIYRIEKIETIMGVDLNDTYTMHHSYLSFMILKLINKLNFELY